VAHLIVSSYDSNGMKGVGFVSGSPRFEQLLDSVNIVGMQQLGECLVSLEVLVTVARQFEQSLIVKDDLSVFDDHDPVTALLDECSVSLFTLRDSLLE
jgi:hypothetical protein